MTEAARKQFAASSDGAAFRLSDIKTHHLSIYRGVRDAALWPDGTDPKGRSGTREPEAGASGKGISRRLLGFLPVGREWIGILALVPLALLYFSPSIVDRPALSTHELAEISPFLLSADLHGDDSSQQVVARVADTWAYLRTGQRREIGESIGRSLSSRGAANVTLLDSKGAMVMRFAQGGIVLLVPHPDDDATGP